MSTTTQLELFSTRAETLGLLATVMNDFRRKGEYLVPDYTFKAALALVLNDNTRRLCEEILEIEDLPEEIECAATRASNLVFALADAVIDADPEEPKRFKSLGRNAEFEVSDLADVLIRYSE